MHPHEAETAPEFWERVYQRSSGVTSGRPSRLLEDYARDLAPGRSLELACGKGDDTIWLAKQGWRATGVDISSTAVRFAQANAERQSAQADAEFRVVDLAVEFPPGRFDLVFAMFLETPLEFPRSAVFRRAADAVKPGGLLLLVGHGSLAPWSWDKSGRPRPTARQILDEVELDALCWDERFVGAIDREARGPGGQTAIVADSVIAVERTAGS